MFSLALWKLLFMKQMKINYINLNSEFTIDIIICLFAQICYRKKKKTTKCVQKC